MRAGGGGGGGRFCPLTADSTSEGGKDAVCFDPIQPVGVRMYVNFITKGGREGRRHSY